MVVVLLLLAVNLTAISRSANRYYLFGEVLLAVRQKMCFYPHAEIQESAENLYCQGFIIM